MDGQGLEARYFFDIILDGDLAAYVSGKAGISIWYFRSGKELDNFEPETGYIKSLSFGPDSKLLATLADHGSGLFWNGEAIIDMGRWISWSS